MLTAPGALPLGSVRVVGQNPRCEGALPGATCTRVEVGCPGLPAIRADIAVTRAPDAEGTVIAHPGEATAFFARPEVLPGLVDAGLDVVQVRWAEDWSLTPSSGFLHAACRPATLVDFVFRRVHRGEQQRGFCALGYSAGSGALAYTLAHYGTHDLFDHVAFVAGPSLSRLDLGCAPDLYDGPPRALCEGLDDAPIELPAGWIDPREHTTTCLAEDPSDADLAVWTRDGVVSAGARFDWPATAIDLLDCIAEPNGSTGGAWLLARELAVEPRTTCFTECEGEDLGLLGWTALRDAVIEECVPRH